MKTPKEIASIMRRMAAAVIVADRKSGAWRAAHYMRAAHIVERMRKIHPHTLARHGIKPRMAGNVLAIARDGEKAPKVAAVIGALSRAPIALRQNGSRGGVPYTRASRIALALIRRLRRKGYKAAVAGSLRRKAKKVGDVDILVAGRPLFRNILPTVVRGGKNIVSGEVDGVKVDIRRVPAKCWGAAMLYFTGSKGYNMVLRTVARRMGGRLSEYGLVLPGRRPIYNEEEIQRALGVPVVPPEMR